MIKYSIIIWCLLVFFIIPVAVGIFVHIREWRIRKIEYYRDLAGFVSEDINKYIDEHENYSEEKALRSYFSDNKRLLEAKSLKRDYEKELELISKNSKRITKEEIQKSKAVLAQKKREEILQKERDFFNN